MASDIKPNRSEILGALNRVLASKSFAGSDSIRHILKFIVESSVSGSADEIKEYTIATQALDRSESYDPKVDNIVRVQMQRLRRKLEEYYCDEGTRDPVRITVPRGHYTPEFNVQETISFSPPVSPRSQSSPATQIRARASSFVTVGLPWGITIALLVASLSMIYRTSGTPNQKEQSFLEAAGPQSSALWKPFLSSNVPLLIVYSNAQLLMDESGDLFRDFSNSQNAAPAGAKVLSLAELDRPKPIPQGTGSLSSFDLYTGTGEVVAAAKISQFLGLRNRGFLIKRSRLVSYEDMKSSNVIFLGANLEDSILRELPAESELVFEQAISHEFIGSLQIRDRHPSPGQPNVYRLQRNQQTGVMEVEYALISFLPNVVPSRYVLSVGGISTLGTQAAAEYATSAESLATLGRMRPAIADPNTPFSYFQALLRVEIREGVPARTTCLFVREARHN